MSHPKLLSSLGLSALLHVLLGVVIYFSFQKPTPTAQPIEIQLTEISPRVESALESSVGKASRRRSAKLSLGQLLPSSRPAASRENTDRNLNSTGTTARPSNTAHYDVLTDSQTYIDGTTEFAGENQAWEFYRSAFDKIDSEFVFDSLLAQYNHFGSVFVEMRLLANGQLDPGSFRVRTQDAILKVHVLRAIRRALAKPFEPNKQNPSGHSTLIRAKFEFLQSSPSWNFEKQKNFAHPVFVFRRATSEKPIPRNLQDQLLSGGISYDPFSMAERWQKYNQRKSRDATSFDPFENYRRDPDYQI